MNAKRENGTRERRSQRRRAESATARRERSLIARLSLDIPKVPRLFQERLDELIEKGRLGRLTRDEDQQLREAIAYLDRLKVRAAGLRSLCPPHCRRAHEPWKPGMVLPGLQRGEARCTP
jgi:hypothetical protein